MEKLRTGMVIDFSKVEEFGEQSTELGRPVFLSWHGWKFNSRRKKIFGCGGCVV